MAEIKGLNKQALDAFDNLNFDQARGLLEQALATADSAGLSRDPAAARTHLNLGMVFIAGLQRRDEGVEQFRAALRVQPDIAPPAGFFNPETQSAFDQTKSAFKTEPPPPPAPRTTNAARRPGAAGSVATVATEKTQGRSAARPGSGIVEFGGSVPESGDEEAEEGEGASRHGVLVFLGIGSGFGTAKGHLEANQNVAQGGGTGTASPNNTWSGGLAASRLAHLSVGGGYFVVPSVLVSLEARIQLVTGTTSAPAYTDSKTNVMYPSKSAPDSAFAVFARGQWYLSPAPVRPFLSAGIGVGNIRQVVSLKDATGKGLADCGGGQQQCVDTVAGGPLLFAAGGGVAYDLRRFLVLASLTANVGVPRLMLNLDVLAGVGMHF
jgi:peptidoglycan hydrolase-like protein with peptidoglycan-binding domain